MPEPRRGPTAARARTAPIVLGWREWVGLPALAPVRIKAKLDTGARTSVLHAFDLQEFTRGGEPWVRFEIHPLQRSMAGAVRCEAPLADRRTVRSSTGHTERRPVIVTDLALGSWRWPSEITLARRDEMGFRMLLGRQAMRRRFAVDPGRSFTQGRPDGTS